MLITLCELWNVATAVVISHFSFVNHCEDTHTSCLCNFNTKQSLFIIIIEFGLSIDAVHANYELVHNFFFSNWTTNKAKNSKRQVNRWKRSSIRNELKRIKSKRVKEENDCQNEETEVCMHSAGWFFILNVQLVFRDFLSFVHFCHRLNIMPEKRIAQRMGEKWKQCNNLRTAKHVQTDRIMRQKDICVIYACCPERLCGFDRWLPFNLIVFYRKYCSMDFWPETKVKVIVHH